MAPIILDDRDSKRIKYANESVRESSDDFVSSQEEFESDESEGKVVPVEQPVEQQFDAAPFKKKNFKTWRDFQDHFDAYCKETYQIFKVRSSTTVHTANERQKNLGFEYPEKCGKYFSKTFICTHGWQPRHRGNLYAI
jgi:hypothetical protein